MTLTNNQFATQMPTINTATSGPFSGSETITNSTTSPKSPFPYSPDSYCLPKSITRPSNPESPLLPTNSPTFLVSGSGLEFKPVFKVPTSPLAAQIGNEINSYVEWVEGEDEEEDENEGLIMFPTYDTPSKAILAGHEEDLELLADDESTEDSYSESTSSETESESNASSRSSSPSLEGEEFDDCDNALCDTWSNTCSTPPLTTPPFIFAEDDISLHTSSQPAHCVDYLAHEWKTDDLWASYKHVHSHREGIRASKRLENALWRVWWRDAKGLERVNPEVIHWLKDSDITWLYGPFQRASSTGSNLLSTPTKKPQTQTQPTSPPPTKSLLKKLHPAKSMQQRSEYTFSLLREATGYRIPSPVPSPAPESEKFLTLDVNALGLKLQEKKGRRVVFNEIVVLYREVVEEPEPEYLDEDRDWEGLGDFDDEFGGVD